jgi:hypothetical protein
MDETKHSWQITISFFGLASKGIPDLLYSHTEHVNPEISEKAAMARNILFLLFQKWVIKTSAITACDNFFLTFNFIITDYGSYDNLVTIVILTIVLFLVENVATYLIIFLTYFMHC